MNPNILVQNSMEQSLREMSLKQYILVFGSIVDQNPDNDTFKERIPFALWKRQVKACDFAELNQITLWPKSRQKGLSEFAAERALKTLMQNENVEGVAISKSEVFADYFLKKRVLAKFKHMEREHPGVFPKLLKETKEELVWEGNRTMKSVASSSTAAASMTLDFLIVDEAGGIDEGRSAYGDKSIFKPILNNSIPTCDQNSDAWIMIIGTSVPGTYYNEIVQEAYDAEMKGEDCPFKYFFIGWHHQPGRDEEWYLRQQGLMKDDVYLQHPTDMDDFFYIKDGLVFKHFDSHEGGKHVMHYNIGTKFYRKIDKDVERINASWNHEIITSYDHGTNHPAVNLYGIYDPFKDYLFVFDETFFQDGHGTSVKDIGIAINMVERAFPKRPNKKIADGAIFNDVGIKSVGSIFRSYGHSFKKAKKHDESASRELLSSRFRDNKIFIHPKCVNTIDQLRTYRWDPKSKGEKPIQHNDDAIDALRYMCAECRVETWEPTSTETDTSYHGSSNDSIGDPMGFEYAMDDRDSETSISQDWQRY